MATFTVNTGCRDNEVCQLRWEWEVCIPELNTSVFVIPSYIIENGKTVWLVKNRQERLVVLHRAAKAVIEKVRGIHPLYVFTYRGKRQKRMLNTAWQNARKQVGLDVRVHDLKHTFGCRLRAAGVSFEDRQSLLGHKSQRITTHYSAADINSLVKAADSIYVEKRHVFTLVRKANPHNIPTMAISGGIKKAL